jgi:P27 family predicted phage terminase small subunit
MAKGNPGRRAIGGVPTKDDAPATIDAPDWLAGEALAIWKRLAPQLATMNVLARVDAMTFGRYCDNFARWLKQKKVLDKEGETYTIETESGEVIRPRPEYLIADRLEKQLTAAEALFALNPSERQRLFAAKAAAGAQPRLPGMEDPPAGEKPSVPAPRPDQPSSPVGLLN